MADVDVSLISDIAGRMLEELDDLVDAMNESVSEIVPSLAADRAITEEMSASNRANIENVLRNLRDDPSGPLPDTPPTEAREILRTVVRRGLELDVMFQSYRRGQTAVWQRFMQIAPMVVPPGPELVAVIERFAEAMFTYVDRVLLDLVAEAQRLREEMLGGALARRTETVRLILDGAPIDERVATGRLGYEVARDHTAVVLWLDDPVGDDGTLESVAASLARALGARPPLNISAGVRTMWAWLPREGDATVDRLRDAANAAPTGVRVAVGPTRWGLAGFRSSHADALVVEQLVAENAGGDRLVTFGDIAPIAALARDELTGGPFVTRQSVRLRHAGCTRRRRRACRPSAHNAAGVSVRGRQRVDNGGTPAHASQHHLATRRQGDRIARAPARRTPIGGHDRARHRPFSRPARPTGRAAHYDGYSMGVTAAARMTS